MKFSLNWLKEWVALDLDAQALAERLTGAGLEVDSVSPVAAASSACAASMTAAARPCRWFAARPMREPG